MPGPYGVTATGFNPMTLQDIKADLESAWRVVFGAGIDVSADSVDGQIIGIMSDRFADLWQALGAMYDAAYPDSATGVGLDNVLSMTGAVRQPASRSTVDVTLSGVPFTVVPSGSIVSVDGTGVEFRSTGDLTIGIGGSVTGTLEAVETGPQYAPAGTLTEIETPVSGWTGCTNTLDQTALGSNVENDPQARQRRELTIRSIGSASCDAIRAGLLNVADVTNANVFENVTDGVVDGMPARSFEAVVLGGDDTEIVQTIWNRKPAGAPTYGNQTGTAFDTAAVAHGINWSRPTELEAYVTLNVEVTSDAPEDIATLIAQAVADWGDLNLTVKSSLVAQALVPTVFSQPGVWDVEVPLIGTAPSPGTSVTLTATVRQIITLDTSRVVVNVTRI